MNRNHDQTERGDNFQWKMNQRCEDDHRKSDHPNHLQKKQKSRIQIEESRGSDDRNLQNDQPEAARNQKARKLALALAPSTLQKCSRARQKHEHRSTEVRYPTRQEKRSSCFR